MGKIFISHSSANNAEALAIDDWLHAQGWADTFLDLDPRRGLVAGDRWQAALKSAADSCELILIVISPDWAASRWCLAEFLLAKSLNKQIVGVLVKPTPYETLPPELTAEWQLVDLTAGKMGWSTTIAPPRLPNETNVAFSEAGLARLSAGLQKAGLDPSHFPWPPADDPDRPPYRGLLPLDAGDAGIFFGRDGMIVLTLDGLRGLRAKAAPRFATILGASGAGKSSFLRAGLLPRLERDSRHFQVLPVIRPERAALTGEHGLAAALLAALGARNIRLNRADIRNAVLAGADAVAPLLRQIVAPIDPGGEPVMPPILVLAVDQAEELLEPGDSAAEAGALLTLLADLARRDDPPLMVIFTIRSDGFGRLQDRPELTGTKPHHLIDLSPMPVGSYGDVIRGPARRLATGGRKLELEEPLVDALLEDIHRGGGKDALPLLAFTLERLYRDYGADGDLKLSEYQQLGRIGGAIEAAVDQALKSADGNPAIPADRAARLALLRRGLIPWLAGIDPDTKSPRRRVARLSEVPDEARPMIQLLVGQRLLSVDRDGQSGETTIEPAHEALLRQWGALDGWLVEDSADLALLEAVRRAASEWAANTNGAEFLAHKGARLGAAEASARQDKFAAYLTENDRAYLRAARAAEDRIVQAARMARLRLTIAGAAVAAVLLVGATIGYFVWQAGEAAKKQAEANFALAQSEALLRAGRPEEAARAALDAYAIMPTTTTRTAALTASMAISPNAVGVVRPSARLVGMAWSGATLGLLTSDGKLGQLDVSTGRIQSGPAAPAAQPPIALAATPSGAFELIYSDGSLVNADGTVIAPAPAPNGLAAFKAVASADGRVVVFKDLEAYVTVRDCRVLPCVDHLVDDADDSSDLIGVRADGGAVAVGAYPGDLLVYRDFASPPRHVDVEGAVLTIAWGPGETLALGTLEDGAQIVDLDRLDADPVQLSYHPARVGAIAFAQPSVVSASCGASEICTYRGVSDAVTGYATKEVYFGHSDAIGQLAWDATGETLASLSHDNSVRLWSALADRRVSFETDHGGGGVLTAIAIDRARDIVAVGDRIGDIWWSINRGAYQAIPHPEGLDDISALTFLADGRLAAIYANQAVAVWTLGQPVPDRLVRLDNLRFSRVAALAGDTGIAVPLSDKTILKLSGAGLVESRVPAGAMPLDQWGLAAAPDGGKVFISYSDGSIHRRDLAGGEESVVYDAKSPICGEAPTADNNGSRSLDVSADGKWLVATRTDSLVIAHNLIDPGRPICFALPADYSKTVAFSPDSKRLAILSATDRLSVYDLSDPQNAYILGVPALPMGSSPEVSSARATSWLAWQDDKTILISTVDGGVESINLDPAAWRARVDSLFVTQ